MPRSSAAASPCQPIRGDSASGCTSSSTAAPTFSAISVVEHLNGSNRPGEQERAEELIERMGYRTVGGSDAHSVSAIGACMTSFDNPIADVADLVRELRAGAYRPVRLEETAATT